MATRLSVTINTGNNKNDGETKRSETAQCCEMLERLAQYLGSTHATSGTIKDRNGNATATYTYTPSSAA